MRQSALASLALSCALATQALAETAMSAAEFDAYTAGKTLTYSVGGEVYGAEQYLTGRRVVWAFKGNICSNGIWYEDAGLICFTYEDYGTPQCWNFYRSGTGLRAEFVGDGPGSELSEVAQSPIPLNCAGPDVGV